MGNIFNLFVNQLLSWMDSKNIYRTLIGRACRGKLGKFGVKLDFLWLQKNSSPSFWKKTGCLMHVDGSGDEKIHTQGLKLFLK